MKKTKIIVLNVLAAALLFPLVTLANSVIPDIDILPRGDATNIVSNFTMWLLGIFGFIAVIAFVISGIMYLTASGDDEQIKKAKKAMTYAIIGVIVGLGGLVVMRLVMNLMNPSN